MPPNVHQMYPTCLDLIKEITIYLIVISLDLIHIHVNIMFTKCTLYTTLTTSIFVYIIGFAYIQSASRVCTIGLKYSRDSSDGNKGLMYSCRGCVTLKNFKFLFASV